MDVVNIVLCRGKGSLGLATTGWDQRHRLNESVHLIIVFVGILFAQ